MSCLCGNVNSREVETSISTEQKKSENLAASKRCTTVTTIVLAILMILAFSLFIYLGDHPIGALIPNTSMHWSTTVSLISFVGLAIGFLVSFIRCINIHKCLVDKNLEARIENIRQRIEQLENEAKEI
jgi:hypothetical protein